MNTYYYVFQLEELLTNPATEERMDSKSPLIIVGLFLDIGIVMDLCIKLLDYGNYIGFVFIKSAF